MKCDGSSESCVKVSEGEGEGGMNGLVGWLEAAIFVTGEIGRRQNHAHTHPLQARAGGGAAAPS